MNPWTKQSEEAADSALPEDKEQSMKQIILASQSPRRKELLGRFCQDMIIRCDSSEEVKISGEKPEEMVMRLALTKARNVAEISEEDAIVIGADTIVVLDDKILGKPKNEEDAFRMLRSLSGKCHTVFTGVAVLDTVIKKEKTIAEATKVCFKTLCDEEIDAYIASKEPMDKAGAYGIQELGSLFIEGIEGDYFNVVGLPVCKLGKLLNEEFSLDILSGK